MRKRASGMEVNQRLVRKGAFVEETFRLFSDWDSGLSLAGNYARAAASARHSAAWDDEILATLRQRFRTLESAKTLIALARNGMDLNHWTTCYLLWIASHEVLFREFVFGWLYPEFADGRYLCRTTDVLPWLLKAWPHLNPDAKPLTEYGARRTARDLLRMARDLGILQGDGPSKTYSPIHPDNALALYLCHAIAELEGASSKVPGSAWWRVLLLNQEQVESILLRLHQFRMLSYQAAGSLVELLLPHTSPHSLAMEWKP